MYLIPSELLGSQICWQGTLFWPDKNQYIQNFDNNNYKILYSIQYNIKDNYDLDNSMMQFYSMPNTRVTNDANAYAMYLYGNMPSGKSSGPDGAFARVKNSLQWINP